MPISPDRAEFFVREAGEYLARMTPLLATNVLSSPDELVRLARALRGATLMAGPPGLIRATTAFENAAKALQGGGLSWGEPIITDVREARSRLDSLVSRASAWGEEERKEVSGLAQVLEELLGTSDTTSPVRSSPVPPLESTPEGVRTFVMREAARIARATEDLLATAARPGPEALLRVLDRMHALRGLALPGHFHALTLVLESLESLLGDLLRGYPPPPIWDRSSPPRLSGCCAAPRDHRERLSPPMWLGWAHLSAPPLRKNAMWCRWSNCSSTRSPRRRAGRGTPRYHLPIRSTW